METEWEATFWPVDKESVRQKLKEVGATLVYPERDMRRIAFHLPEGNPLVTGFARVRDEGDRVTMSVKETGTTLTEQREVEIVVDSFEEAIALATALGCRQKAYQETRRELWQLGGADITLDEWPFLEPLVEVEGPSEEVIRAVSQQLGFGWEHARFGSADLLYAERYGIRPEVVSAETPRLVFDEPNPFLEAGK